jgi:D-lactate dehydrogenase
MGDAPLVKKLETSFAYDGIDTCAVDGICAISCPVGINTGDLVRNLRSTQSSAFQAWMWGTAARYWSPFLRLSRTGIQLASVLPKFRGVKLVAGAKRTSSEIPDVDLVYLPSCTNELFGPTNQPLFVELCELAGLKVYTPSEISSMCCSTPWKSKGMSKGSAVVKDRNSLIESQLQSLGVPVVTDSPSCTDGFNNSFRSLKVLDTTEYLAKVLIAKLPITKIDRVVVHPTCSSAKIDENASLFEVAHAIADEVIVPPNWGCCAFAGDRGLLHPELTKSATEAEAEYVKSVKSQYFISNNRTCEMAMTAAVGSRYVSVLQLLHDQIQG